MPVKTDKQESWQVNMWMKKRFVEMLDMIVEYEADLGQSSRSDVVAGLIAREFRRRKLKLNID